MTQEQPKTSLFCHAQISVIMCNHHLCRFSGSCEGVSKGSVEELRAVWSVWQIDKLASETRAGRNPQTPQTRRACLILMSPFLLQNSEKKNTPKHFWMELLKFCQSALQFDSRHKGELFVRRLNTCKRAFAQFSVVRCNTCVSLKRRESSQGKCPWMCFRYCFIAVSSLTSSTKLPLDTKRSLYLQEFLRLKYQNSTKQLVSPHQKADAVVWLMSPVAKFEGSKKKNPLQWCSFWFERLRCPRESWS